MKNILYALCAFLMIQNANAASTATLVLKGIVNANYDISVVSETVAQNLDVVAGCTNLLVGTATEKTNNPSGYKVLLSSANAGSLVNSTYDTAPYQISYNGGSMQTLSNTPVVVKTSSTHAVGGVTSLIKVTMATKPNALAGIYSDVVTVTIQAP